MNLGITASDKGGVVGELPKMSFGNEGDEPPKPEVPETTPDVPETKPATPPPWRMCRWRISPWRIMAHGG